MRCFGNITRVSAALSIVLFAAQTVHAGGLEFAGAGAQSLGRGAAVTARADDPMVLSYNPAGLAELRGNQLLLDNNIVMMNACMDPIGYYGWGTYGATSTSKLSKGGQTLLVPPGGSMDPAAMQYANDKLDSVCMNGGTLPIPQLAATFRLTERLGVGLGLIFPAATPFGKWGDEKGLIQGANGIRPAATRYMLINTGTLGIFPTVGFGFRLSKWLRIGAAFEWGMINVDNTNTAVAFGGTTPAQDIIARVQAVDWFIPAVNASVHLVPFDAVDIVAAFRYQDDLHAKGNIKLDTNEFDAAGVPNISNEVVTDLHQKFPWKIRGGIRYASRLAPRPSGTGAGEASIAGSGSGRVHDPMEDERWDIEADLEYQMNSRTTDQTLTFAPNQQVLFVNSSGQTTSAAFPQMVRVGGGTQTVIPKHWKDQMSVRVGGTYNVLPGRFAISLGAHYENRGVDPAYMQIDFWPVSRVGLHAGVKIRVARTIDLVLSYAHMFQETLVLGAPVNDTNDKIVGRYNMTGLVDAIDKRVGAPASRGMEVPPLEEQKPARVDATAALPQNATQASSSRPPYVVNAGTYRSSIDVIAIGANVHF